MGSTSCGAGFNIWRVLPGDAGSEASWRGLPASFLPFGLWAVPVLCLPSDPTKGTFVPLTTCGLLLHGHGEDTQAFRLLQKRTEDFAWFLP